jgi:hypothetical protein
MALAQWEPKRWPTIDNSSVIDLMKKEVTLGTVITVDGHLHEDGSLSACFPNVLSYIWENEMNRKRTYPHTSFFFFLKQ